MFESLEELSRATQERFADRIIVHGEGNPKPVVVLIGEAPGEKEELLRRPFVGKAGENLNEFLQLSGIERESLYITNAVKFRPTAVGKSGKSVNRKPTQAEIGAFRPILLEEIRLLSPKLVVTLGNVPLGAVRNEKQSIGEVHGRFLPMERYSLYPMYHPASVIYNRSLREVYIEDVKRLGAWLRQNA